MSGQGNDDCNPQGVPRPQRFAPLRMYPHQTRVADLKPGDVLPSRFGGDKEILDVREDHPTYGETSVLAASTVTSMDAEQLAIFWMVAASDEEIVAYSAELR